jgi:hypothetical protein
MTLSSLDEITQYLEQHENSQRIKKLIFFTCKDEWENDQNTLDRFKLQELIQELSSLNPTVDNLILSLSFAVKNLSKPKQYSIIARIIIKEIQKLYLTSHEEREIILNPPHPEKETEIILNPPHPEGETGIILNPPNQNIPVFYSPEKPSSHSQNKPPSSSKKSQYNHFDLRQNLMRYSNPLRVKIILFSALYRKFTFNEEDWLKLRSEELDKLLRKLFDSCETIVELESKINNAVSSLGSPTKNNPPASAIIRIMRGLYGDISASVNSGKPVNIDSSEKTRVIAKSNYQTAPIGLDDFCENDDDDSDNNTCQITPPPH